MVTAGPGTPVLLPASRSLALVLLLGRLSVRFSVGLSVFRPGRLEVLTQASSLRRRVSKIHSRKHLSLFLPLAFLFYFPPLLCVALPQVIYIYIS